MAAGPADHGRRVAQQLWRSHWLAERETFEIFVAVVLCCLGSRMAQAALSRATAPADVGEKAVLPPVLPLLAAALAIGVIDTIYGIGGLVGGSLDALCQRHVPQRALQFLLAVILLGLAWHYAGF